MQFSGAKLAIFAGPHLLVYLRDDTPSIPWPGAWDIAGGGREGGEGPLTCALREAREEFGLRVPRARVRGAFRHRHGPGGKVAWFYAAHLSRQAAARVRFGDEGQYWCRMTPRRFVRTPNGIPHLQALVAAHLRARRSRSPSARHSAGTGPAQRP